MPSILDKLTKSNATPTRRVTGTSLTAKPAIVPAPNSYKELGSQKSSPIRDLVPELGNKTLATKVYNRMIKGDVSVRISLRAGKAPVLGGDYYFDPFDDSEINVQIAEFCNTNIFHMTSTPWLLVLFNILHMLEYGSSVMEPVFELREWAPKKTSKGANRKQYTMLRKLSYRPQSSIVKFNYDDNGGPDSVTHTAIRKDNTADTIDLPIDKILVFTFEGDGGNLEGESILRPAYEHWYYKHQLYKIDGIQKERHGIGVPTITLQPGYTPADKEYAHELGRNLRTNEYAYIVGTTMHDVGFAELHGNIVDVLASASHHDLQIMKNVLLAFLEVDVSGSRATAATSADIFLKSMRWLAEYVCEIFNKFLVPQMVAYNFDTDEFPTMKVRNIGEVKDLQMWSTAIANLVDKNVITVDDETEAFVRDVVQFPKKLQKRPIAATVSNVKEQYLLRDNPDTPQNEDLAGQAAVQKAALNPGTGGGGTGATSGNINKGTLSGA